MRDPVILPENYYEAAEDNPAAKVLAAFRTAHLTRRPRSSDKAEWLKTQGIDPDETFADRE